MKGIIDALQQDYERLLESWRLPAPKPINRPEHESQGCG
jgi:hypothetical protein